LLPFELVYPTGGGESCVCLAHIGRVRSVPGGLGSVPGGFGSLPGGLGSLPGGLGSLPGGFGAVPGAPGSPPGAPPNAPRRALLGSWWPQVRPRRTGEESRRSSCRLSALSDPSLARHGRILAPLPCRPAAVFRAPDSALGHASSRRPKPLDTSSEPRPHTSRPPSVRPRSPRRSQGNRAQSRRKEQPARRRPAIIRIPRNRRGIEHLFTTRWLERAL
jgi:hypothetical protein